MSLAKENAMSPTSEAQRNASVKHKKNFQYITFKACKGTKERFAEAAIAAGKVQANKHAALLGIVREGPFC